MSDLLVPPTEFEIAEAYYAAKHRIPAPYVDVIKRLACQWSKQKTEIERLRKLIIIDSDKRIVTQGAFNAAMAEIERLKQRVRDLENHIMANTIYGPSHSD